MSKKKERNYISNCHFAAVAHKISPKKNKLPVNFET